MAQQQNLAQMEPTHYIGDFKDGEVLRHRGRIQITRPMNQLYMLSFGDGLVLGASPDLAELLGYKDPEAESKLAKYGGQPYGLVSRGLVFNAGFGLTVHGVSYHAIANLSYSNLLFGVPVFEWDTLSAESEVLGKQFRRDGSTNGSVQVRTTVFNQRGETVLRYERLVLVNAAPGQTHAASDTTQKQPDRIRQPDGRISLEGLVLPEQYHNLPGELQGEHGMTFEQFTVGTVYEGLFRKGLTKEGFRWLPSMTLNDAPVHFTPPLFLGYGGAVKAVAEGQVSGRFPFAVPLGMISGTHDAPTYPSDIVRDTFGEGREGLHEQLRSRIKVVDAVTVQGREDLGILVVQITADKLVTAAGRDALNAAVFRGTDKIREEGGERLLQVFDSIQVLAVPREQAFMARR